MKEYIIDPVAKPRMSQRDKWQLRPCVARYRAFCDEARALGMTLPNSGAMIVWFLPMPKSWSKKKKKEYHGRPHQQKPDISNLLKALEDAVRKDDEKIWGYGSLMKLWGDEGKIRFWHET